MGGRWQVIDNATIYDPETRPEQFKESPLGKVPIDWEVIELGVCLTVQSGFAFRNQDYVERGLLNFRVTNVGQSIQDLGDQKYLPLSFWEHYQDQRLYGDEILLVMVGATTGKLGRVPKEVCPALQNQNTWNLIPTEKVNRDFFWCLLPDAVARHMRLSQGSARDFITQKGFVQTLVAIPDKAEQRRIAEILDAADEAIRATERVIAKLRQIKAGLLHDLLTRGLDALGRLRDPVAHPEQFKDSPLGRIPREWEVKTIDDLAVHVGSGATPRGGSEVYQSEGVIFIRSQNVMFERLLLDDVACISDSIHKDMARSEIFAHDVLLNITGASIGRCCPVPENLGLANVNQHVCTIRLPNPNHEDAVYLSTVLASNIGQHQIDQFNAGSNREGLNYGQLRSFVIPWPEASERARIAAILDAHDARIRAEEAALAKLRQVKRGLMDDLLTGKVRV